MIDEARASSPRGSSKPPAVERRTAGPHWQPLFEAVERANETRVEDPSAPRHRYGHFEIEALIGCGGMGIVLRARDLRLDRDVALKLWNVGGDEAGAALLHEARCQARIAHPNVVTIYEAGKIGDDVYLAMELVDGVDARRWVSARRRRWQQVLALFVHAGRGLAAVHARGLVHADFKPENVLVDDRAGRVLVADFGVARVLDEHDGEGGDGNGGSSGRGTKVYMAPERIARRGTDARSDQFSFCVSLWECMYGARPFVGESPEELLASMRAGERQIGDSLLGVPRRLREILVRGLALAPDDRFESVEELVAALDDVPAVHRRRRRRVVAVVSLASVGALGALVGRSWGGNEAPAISESVLPHDDPGITTEPTPTPKPDDQISAEEILRQIDDGHFDGARSDWQRQRDVDRVAGRSAEAEDLALRAGQAFLDAAIERTGEDPEAALKAARYAVQCASAVTLEHDASTDGAALAEDISTDAAKLIARLAPIVDETGG